MFTTEGGVEIEQVAAETPNCSRVHVDPLEGFRPEQADELLARVGDAGERRQIAEILKRLVRCFDETDAFSARSTR
jgi:succinyl-CoA synthetase beta subunit